MHPVGVYRFVPSLLILFQVLVLIVFLVYRTKLSADCMSPVPPAYYAHLAAFRARYYIEGEEESSSSGGRSTVRENRPLPVIKDNVKDVMFYC